MSTPTTTSQLERLPGPQLVRAVRIALVTRLHVDRHDVEHGFVHRALDELEHRAENGELDPVPARPHLELVAPSGYAAAHRANRAALELELNAYHRDPVNWPLIVALAGCLAFWPAAVYLVLEALA